MKKLLIIIALASAALVACTSAEETTWDKYRDYRELNEAWLRELQERTDADGNPYYVTIVPVWNPGGYVLMHWFNDRSLTAGKLSPLYTSTVDTRYRLTLFDGTAVDSSDELTITAQKGIFRTQLNTTVQGWAAALQEMHCGDTCEVIIPYNMGYGAQDNGDVKPYSTLRFNIRLVDIPFYEKPPYTF